MNEEERELLQKNFPITYWEMIAEEGGKNSLCVSLQEDLPKDIVNQIEKRLKEKLIYKDNGVNSRREAENIIETIIDEHIATGRLSWINDDVKKYPFRITLGVGNDTRRY